MDEEVRAAISRFLCKLTTEPSYRAGVFDGDLVPDWQSLGINDPEDLSRVTLITAQASLGDGFQTLQKFADNIVKQNPDLYPPETRS